MSRQFNRTKSLEDGLCKLLNEIDAYPDEKNSEKVTKSNGKGNFPEKKSGSTEEKAKDAESLLISARQNLQERNESLQNK